MITTINEELALFFLFGALFFEALLNTMIAAYWTLIFVVVMADVAKYLSRSLD